MEISILESNDSWAISNVSSYQDLFNIIKSEIMHSGAICSSKRLYSTISRITLMTIDINNDLIKSSSIVNYNDFKNFEFVKNNAYLIVTTKNHTNEVQRLRIYFKFKEPLQQYSNSNYTIENYSFFATTIEKYFKTYLIDTNDPYASDRLKYNLGAANSQILYFNENAELDYFQILDLEKKIQFFEKLQKINEQAYNYFTQEHAQHVYDFTKNFLINLSPEDLALYYISASKFVYIPNSNFFLTLLADNNLLFKYFIFFNIYLYSTNYLNAELVDVINNYAFYRNQFFTFLANTNDNFSFLKQFVEVYDAHPGAFWERVENKKSYSIQFKINLHKLYDFIKNENFKLLNYQNSQDVELVKINKNRIEFYTVEKLKNYLTNTNNLNKLFFNNSIIEEQEKIQIETLLYKEIPELVQYSKIHFLDYFSPDLLTDNENTFYFTFRNNVVKITKNNIETLEYSDATINNKHIFTSDIINFDINIYPDFYKQFLEFINNFENLNFDTDLNKFLNSLKSLGFSESFLKNNYLFFLAYITHSSKNKFLSLINSIAYILHRFKQHSQAFAVFVTEVTKNDLAEGGTGKTLIWKPFYDDIAKKLRNFSEQDGKQFDNKIDKSFALQSLEINTNVVFINDIKKNFNIENLYTMLTEGLTIEKKFKSPIYVDFSKSPKFLITSNYPINFTSASDKRRVLIVEIDRFFSNEYRVVDHFEQEFIYGWDERDWNIFYNIVFCFCRYYLQNNRKVLQHTTDTLLEGQLRTATSDKFVDFVKQYIKYNVYYSSLKLAKLWAIFNDVVFEHIDDKVLRPYSVQLFKFLKKFEQIYNKKIYKKRARKSNVFITIVAICDINISESNIVEDDNSNEDFDFATNSNNYNDFDDNVF